MEDVECGRGEFAREPDLLDQCADQAGAGAAGAEFNVRGEVGAEAVVVFAVDEERVLDVGAEGFEIVDEAEEGDVDSGWVREERREVDGHAERPGWCRD